MANPKIEEVIKAYEWQRNEGINGKLEQLYPAGIPEILVSALTMFSRGYSAGYREKLAQEERERQLNRPK